MNKYDYLLHLPVELLRAIIKKMSTEEIESLLVLLGEEN